MGKHRRRCGKRLVFGPRDVFGKVDLAGDIAHLRTSPLDDLLDTAAWEKQITGREQPSATLRQVIQEREEGIEHPSLGTICYEYHGQWTGHQVVGGCGIDIYVYGTIDGPDPILADDLASALSNFAACWGDALILIREEAHQFGIRNPDGFTPTRIACKGRKGRKRAVTLSMSLAGDKRGWWVEFEDHRATGFGYYTGGRRMW